MLASKVLIPRNGQFKLRRPYITTNGFTSDTDTVVKNILDEINMLLSKRVFLLPDDDIRFDTTTIKDGAASKKDSSASSINVSNSLPDMLRLPLENKVVGENHKEEDQWPSGSLLSRLYKEKPTPDKLTIDECIDKTGELASAKYEYQTRMSATWLVLDANTKTVLRYDGITDYLIAVAYFVRKIEDVNGIINFVLSSVSGSKKFINYAIVSSARFYINQEKVNVSYNKDTDIVIQNILAANLTLSDSFKNNVDKIVYQQIYSDNELDLIRKANIGVIPADLIPQLIVLIKHSPVPITEKNVNYFLPLFITQLRSAEPLADEVNTEIDTSDSDFEIERFIDDKSTVQISASNVECAAQLFYSMTLGDELDIFNVVNYFTHKYMVRGNIQIQDKRLRDDLQLYVFSNRFTDTKTNKILDRTRLPERQMFYKQVFNYGNAQTTDDMIVNKEFPKLWRILITESANYLERAQDSPNPDMYVSRQTVMQAVEDLQYNLSTSCTGMANVISPIIYKELAFVIKRIFMHKEIMQQVVPAGGSWWKVVETIYGEMKGTKPKITVLNNKANLGYDIIKSIATYNPSTFEEDSEFSSFISNVDAYIITQAQLQEEDDDHKISAMPSVNGNGKMNIPDVANIVKAVTPATNGTQKNDEWDF